LIINYIIIKMSHYTEEYIYIKIEPSFLVNI